MRYPAETIETMRKHLLSYRDDMRVEVEHGIPVTAVHREAHVKTKSCPDCNGDGVIGKGTDDEQQCPTCGGSGFVPDDDDDEEVTHTGS